MAILWEKKINEAAIIKATKKLSGIVTARDLYRHFDSLLEYNYAFTVVRLYQFGGKTKDRYQVRCRLFQKMRL